VLGALGYRAITNRTASQIGQLITAFINRKKSGKVRVKYNGSEVEIEADGTSEEAVQRLTHLLVRQSQNDDDK
jgi:acylphosphatase